MWAQTFENIYDLVKPFPDEPEVDYSAILRDKGYTPEAMFGMAEEFFTSLGLPPMTEAFKKNSMITRPSGRDVVCHASASDFYNDGDFR